MLCRSQFNVSICVNSRIYSSARSQVRSHSKWIAYCLSLERQWRRRQPRRAMRTFICLLNLKLKLWTQQQEQSQRERKREKKKTIVAFVRNIWINNESSMALTYTNTDHASSIYSTNRKLITYPISHVPLSCTNNDKCHCVQKEKEKKEQQNSFSKLTLLFIDDKCK